MIMISGFYLFDETPRRPLLLAEANISDVSGSFPPHQCALFSKFEVNYLI